MHGFSMAEPSLVGRLRGYGDLLDPSPPSRHLPKKDALGFKGTGHCSLLSFKGVQGYAGHFKKLQCQPACVDYWLAQCVLQGLSAYIASCRAVALVPWQHPKLNLDTNSGLCL
jgi:hypothetical protein